MSDKRQPFDKNRQNLNTRNDTQKKPNEQKKNSKLDKYSDKNRQHQDDANKRTR